MTFWIVWSQNVVFFLRRYTCVRRKNAYNQLKRSTPFILENVFTVCCVFFMQKGLTALMYAVQHEHVRVVKELLLAGADGTARDRVRISLVQSNEWETLWCDVAHVHQPLTVSRLGNFFHVHTSSQYGSLSMFTADCSIWQNGRTVMDMAKDKENQEIIGLLNRQTAVANPNVSHGEIIVVIYYTWQSCVENEEYPVAYFRRFAAFEAAYHWTSGLAHALKTHEYLMHLRSTYKSHPQQYSTLYATMRSKYSTDSISTQDCHTFHHQDATHVRTHDSSLFRNWFFTQMLCHWTSIKRETYTYPVEVSVCYVFTHITTTYTSQCNNSTCYSAGQKSNVIPSHI